MGSKYIERLGSIMHTSLSTRQPKVPHSPSPGVGASPIAAPPLPPRTWIPPPRTCQTPPCPVGRTSHARGARPARGLLRSLVPTGRERPKAMHAHTSELLWIRSCTNLACLPHALCMPFNARATIRFELSGHVGQPSRPSHAHMRMHATLRMSD